MRHLKQVKLDVKLESPVIGQQLADAAKTVARESYHEDIHSVRDGTPYYLIGNSPREEYKRIVIAVGPMQDVGILMGAYYDNVRVLSWSHGGRRRVVEWTQNQVNQAVREFRDKLQAELLKGEKAHG